MPAAWREGFGALGAAVAGQLGFALVPEIHAGRGFTTLTM
jgi:hypothetical protein